MKHIGIGDLPTDWEVREIGLVSATSSGTTPSRNFRDRYYLNGSTPWVKTLDLNNSSIFATEECVTDVALRETSLRVYPPGTVLIAMYGGFNQIGRTGLLEVAAAVNQAITAIRPIASLLDSRYLLAQLNFRIGHWKSVASSSRKDANITGADVREFVVPLPHPTEQRAIAAALGDVDALLGALDRIIAKKRAIKQVAMRQLLTGQTRLPGFSGKWLSERMGDMFTFLKSANNPRADLNADGDVGYIHYGDIHATASAFLDCETTLLPRITATRVRTATPLEDGDLVMADASEDYAGIGKCVEVTGVGRQRVVAGLHTFVLRANPEFLVKGFRGYLQFIPVVRESLVRLATGISVYGISKSNVRSIELTVPKPKEQTAIAKVLSDMDAELTALERRRDKTRLLKQGMMQELLTGRTRLV